MGVRTPSLLTVTSVQTVPIVVPVRAPPVTEAVAMAHRAAPQSRASTGPVCACLNAMVGNVVAMGVVAFVATAGKGPQPIGSPLRAVDKLSRPRPVKFRASRTERLG